MIWVHEPYEEGKDIVRRVVVKEENSFILKFEDDLTEQDVTEIDIYEWIYWNNPEMQYNIMNK
jgi:hypothetical protein